MGFQMKISVVFKLLADLVDHLGNVLITIVGALFVEVEPDILEVKLSQLVIDQLVVLSQLALLSAPPD